MGSAQEVDLAYLQTGISGLTFWGTRYFVNSEYRLSLNQILPCKQHSVCPGGGLGIFTDRDQRCSFGVSNLKNLYFLGTAHSCGIFWGLLDKCCIFKCFIFQQYFGGSNFIHLVLQ